MGNLNETNDKDEDRNTAKDYFVYIFLEIGKEFSSQFESGQHSIRSTMTGGPKSETETAVNSGDISTECKRRQRVGARARAAVSIDQIFVSPPLVSSPVAASLCIPLES